jgi:hypothetical protein
MKNFRGFAMGLVLGLGLAVSGLAFAQNTTQNDQKNESCCAMACCCKGDSCSMKDHKEHAANHAGCCCCGGDSCDMKAHETKDKPKN